MVQQVIYIYITNPWWTTSDFPFKTNTSGVAFRRSAPLRSAASAWAWDVFGSQKSTRTATTTSSKDSHDQHMVESCFSVEILYFSVAPLVKRLNKHQAVQLASRKLAPASWVFRSKQPKSSADLSGKHQQIPFQKVSKQSWNISTPLWMDMYFPVFSETPKFEQHPGKKNHMFNI